MRINRPPAVEPDHLPAMTENELAVIPHNYIALSDRPEDGTLAADLYKANVYWKSGFFNVNSAEEAFSKLQLGRELGFGEVTALREIYAVNGRLAVSAALLAARLRKHFKNYDYRVLKLDSTIAVIHFFFKDEFAGESIFTFEDAKKAKLDSKFTWQAYPRNMLWSRAFVNGVRWYCPDVALGLHTMDESGEDVLEDTIVE